MMITKIVLIAAVVLLVVYDIAAIVFFGDIATISWNVYSWSKTYPIIPFAIGFVMGHLFWRIDDPRGKK